MNRFARKLLAVAVFGAIACFTVNAADDKPVKSDWSGFATVGSLDGTIKEATTEGITLKVTWYTSGGGSGSSAMSRLRTLQSGGTPRSGGGGNLRAHSEDYELTFAEAGLVRWYKAPPKLDEKGKKTFYTPKEQEIMKQPYGAPGYAAARSDLKEGQIVQVVLVRPREKPLSKTEVTDLRVKYAVIVGEDPAMAAKAPEKKKK